MPLRRLIFLASLVLAVVAMSPSAALAAAHGTDRPLTGTATGTTTLNLITGEQLVGRRYKPLFGFFSEQPNAFRVLAADFVDVEEGTGIVHLAHMEREAALSI